MGRTAAPTRAPRTCPTRCFLTTFTTPSGKPSLRPAVMVTTRSKGAKTCFVSPAAVKRPRKPIFAPSAANRSPGPRARIGPGRGPVGQTQTAHGRLEKGGAGWGCGHRAHRGPLFVPDQRPAHPRQQPAQRPSERRSRGGLQGDLRDLPEGDAAGGFRAVRRDLPGPCQQQEASFSERRIENELGYVRGTLTDQDGGVLPIEYQLVKENESWKILGINIPTAG